MATKRLTGDLAQTTVGINPGILVPGLATQVIGLTDWAITIKQKSIDGSTTDDDAWEDWLPSMSSWTAKAKFCYLMGDPSQLTNIIQATIGTGRRTSSEWNFFLDSESGDDSFSGQAFISGLGISSIIGRTISMDVTLQGRGPLNLRNRAGLIASLVLPTGHATKVASNVLGGYSWGAIWSTFVPVSILPPDAVIVGIYPVIIASGVFDICFQNLFYSAEFVGGFGSGTTGIPFTSPYGTGAISPGATFASTEFTAVSIGTSLALLAGQKIAVTIDSSLLNSSIDDSITTTGLGFAIYYTSATPITDPLMPPPVTVPAGQGVAWAVPFNVDLVMEAGRTEGTTVAAAALAED
jgi:hypothetical protein